LCCLNAKPLSFRVEQRKTAAGRPPLDALAGLYGSPTAAVNGNGGVYPFAWFRKIKNNPLTNFFYFFF
jgi:hypothetical protein